MAKQLDDLISYYTPKRVQIRNWRLGAFYYIQVFAIFLYIIVYLVCYRGHHLQPNPVEGTANLRIQHPTKECNPLHASCEADWTPLDKVPYCDVYNGDKHVAKALECTVRDNINVSVIGHAPGVLFLPTRFSHFEQKRSCTPSKQNGYWCKNVYSFEAEAKEKSFYLADSERFTLLIDHSFQSVNQVTGSLLEDGKAADYIGGLKPYVERKSHEQLWKGKAALRHPLRTFTDEDIPSAKEDPLKEFPSVLMISLGDIISVGDLLKLADPRGATLLDTAPPDGLPLRWSGGVIIINIEYSNLRKWDPFCNAPTRYVMSATLLSSEEYKKMLGHPTEEGRVIHDVHGFLIIAKIHGRIHSFEFQNFLLVMTTSMALFAVSSLLTDILMVYILPFRAKYGILKYQQSQRFTELSTIISGIKRQDAISRQSSEYSHFVESGSLSDSHAESAHERILHDAIENKSPPAGADLLVVLTKIEERLNRLDGMGAQEIDHASSQALNTYVEHFETNHWRNRHSVEMKSLTE